jgi:hypothetical protein
MIRMKKFLMKGRDLGVGDYEPRVVKKGVEETTLDIKEGEVYWVVQVDEEGQMDVKEQIDAEILSRLIKIEAVLKRNFRRLV